MDTTLVHQLSFLSFLCLNYLYFTWVFRHAASSFVLPLSSFFFCFLIDTPHTRLSFQLTTIWESPCWYKNTILSVSLLFSLQPKKQKQMTSLCDRLLVTNYQRMQTKIGLLLHLSVMCTQSTNSSLELGPWFVPLKMLRYEDCGENEWKGRQSSFWVYLCKF